MHMPRCVPHPSQSCRETGEFPQRLAEKTRRRREQLLVGRFLVKQRHAWRVCETLYYLLSSPRSFPRFLLFLILLLTRHFEKSLLLRLEQCGVVSHAEREAILLRLLHDFQDSLYSCSMRERVFAHTQTDICAGSVNVWLPFSYLDQSHTHTHACRGREREACTHA